MRERNQVIETPGDGKKVIKQFYTDIPGFSERIYGKVIKCAQGDHTNYLGEVSHYFLFAQDSPAYIGEDDNIIRLDPEQASIIVQQHLENFDPTFGIKENKYY